MSVRKVGDPISGQFVRRARERAGLTQDEFAARLGLHGGKGVISGWETGRTRCEGPTAELVIFLFGAGDTITGMQFAMLCPEEQALYEQVPTGDLYTRTRAIS